MALSPSPSLQTAHRVIAAYNTWTLDALLAVRSPTCTHQVLPSQHNLPPLTNAQYAAFLQPVLAAFRDFRLTVLDTVEDAAARKVAMRVSSSAVTDIGEYRYDNMIVMHMSADGAAVERFFEWADSGYSLGFVTRLLEHIAEKEKEKEREGGGGE
ncbi:hypothetical protein MMC12_002629 [Toensbergia leucococca]|nr:hypothetical protein [Toensbergia leucococca]